MPVEKFASPWFPTGESCSTSQMHYKQPMWQNRAATQKREGYYVALWPFSLEFLSQRKWFSMAPDVQAEDEIKMFTSVSCLHCSWSEPELITITVEKPLVFIHCREKPDVGMCQRVFWLVKHGPWSTVNHNQINSGLKSIIIIIIIMKTISIHPFSIS